MLEKQVFEILNMIQPLDQSAMLLAKEREDSLAKPPGSLGRLEEIAIQLAGISGKVQNQGEKSCVVIMCGDNGVVEEGVSSAPQSVTLAQTINFTRRLTGVGTLAKFFHSDLLVVDAGVVGEIPNNLLTDNPLEVIDGELRATSKIVNRKINKGTCNLANEPSMTREEALLAIGIGLEMAKKLKEAGYDIFGIGEMGIGNTTTSSAILSSLSGLSARETVGRGGGINDKSLQRKIKIVESVTAEYGFDGREGIDVIDVLAKVGGYDIAAMCGAFLGAAAYRIPVVIDGFISVIAALAAYRIKPEVKEFMIASHISKEPGYEHALKMIGIPPMINLEMRLGEGSGCPLAFQIVRGACAIMNNMATFEEAEINDEYLEEIRKIDF